MGWGGLLLICRLLKECDIWLWVFMVFECCCFLWLVVFLLLCCGESEDFLSLLSSVFCEL